MNNKKELVLSLFLVGVLLSPTIFVGSKTEAVAISNDVKDFEIKEEVSLLKNAKVKTDNYVYSNIRFNQYDLREVSNITEDELGQVLEGTGLYELKAYYIEAEKTYGINALFLVGITALESAWGTSDRAVYDNNYTGFGVYEDHSEGINSDTKRGNILATAKCLYTEYLIETGEYFNGYSLEEVNIRYSINSDGNPNYVWSSEIYKIASDLQDKILNIRQSNYDKIYQENLNILINS